MPVDKSNDPKLNPNKQITHLISNDDVLVISIKLLEQKNKIQTAN
jgi:hypothetical protein